MRLGKQLLVACAAGGLILSAPLWAQQPAPGQPPATGKTSLEEVRNTVINLLQALVQKGLLTREQAEQLVRQAEDKAAADAAKNAAQAKEEEGAVRVPYVPQIVQDQISKQVAEQVKPAVVADVVQQAKTEKWGVPASLPEWLSRVRVYGDVTVRAEGDFYPSDNSYNQIYDYNAINAAGGITKTPYPFLDTTIDRDRLRLRARLGVEGDITEWLKAYIRLSTGSITSFAGSESQTLGTYGNRYQVGFDQAYIAWNTDAAAHHWSTTLWAGRFQDPWFAPTELAWARDLTFEGLVDTLRYGWADEPRDSQQVFLTLGAFPMLEVPYASRSDKWMLGAQLGTLLHLNNDDDQLRMAVAYYDFLNVTGIQNVAGQPSTNYTAPAFVQNGNTLFNIADKTLDPTSDLFALAAHYRIVDLAARYEHQLWRYSMALAAEAGRNVAYNRTTIESLSGQTFSSNQNYAYVAEFSFGDPEVLRRGAWRAALGYRYAQADAVLDAWTDADFHGGGTNALGYYLWGSYGIAPNAWLRLRYMSAHEITGPRYGLDIVQLDANVRF